MAIAKTPILSVRHGEVKKHARWPLILIGLGKLCKAIFLIVVSFYILKLLKPEVHNYWEGVLEDWRDDPHSHILYGALEKMLQVSTGQLKALRIGVLVYAGLYGTEGVGLLFDKPWAEWMTVITTAGFIPVEIYEVCRGPSWGKVVLLAFNVAALVYLIFRLRWRSQVKKAEKGELAAGAAPAAAGRPVETAASEPV